MTWYFVCMTKISIACTRIALECCYGVNVDLHALIVQYMHVTVLFYLVLITCISLHQVFAIVVFSCVADQLYDPKIDFCVYHLNGDCCKYSIAVGVIGFCLCLIFLAKDVIYNVMDLSDHLRVSEHWVCL